MKINNAVIRISSICIINNFGNLDVCYRYDKTTMMGKLRKKKVDDMSRKS